MATKGLGNETLVTSILRSNTVLVEVGGSVRRITVENFMNAINNGDEQMLRQVAWGIPIKQSTQSSTNYGVIGNTAAWTEYKLYCGRYLVMEGLLKCPLPIVRCLLMVLRWMKPKGM